MSFSPLYVKGMATGLVQERIEFILPDDAYPILENAFVWRERIKRKQGLKPLGRLRRVTDNGDLGLSGASPWSFNIYSTLIPPIVPEINAQIELGSVFITINPVITTGAIIGYNNTTNCEVFTAAPHGLSTGNSISISGVTVKPGTGDNEINGGPYIISVVSATSFTINQNSVTWGQYLAGGTWTHITAAGQQLIDQGNGTLATDPTSATVGTINYLTGDVTITNASVGAAVLIDFAYFPSLPVMGLRTRELNAVNDEMVVAFDTKYAYRYNGSGWEEFIPGTTWTGTDYNFFWSTNYWTLNNNKLFWVTNFSGSTGDPIRYTDGVTWFNFGAASTVPKTGLITPLTGGNPEIYLNQSLVLLPFRGRLVAFNTWEGQNLLSSVNYPQRIRWAAIGNPLLVDSVGPPAIVGAWRDDIRGKGGFLDIPTSEDIVAVGFVRDNLVIYCERSTWQLRYTGRTIAPFQIEKVNSELGAESTFSAIQFDTSLVGIGDKGIVECDSYQSSRIDIKIPDLTFYFNNDAQGPKRVHGIRNFKQRLAYWTYPYKPDMEETDVYPNRRLVYNYENDSWAIFIDSFTTFGTFQPESGYRWLDYTQPNSDDWQNQNVSWIFQPSLILDIIAGNQQGFISKLDQQVKNGVSLYIKGIVGNAATLTATRLEIPNHNLQQDQVIQIENIPLGADFDSLNGGIFGVDRIDNDHVDLYTYNDSTKLFSDPQQNPSGTYIGGGNVAVLDNFRVVSKKFNFLDQGSCILLGYIDILLDATEDGAITLNVYLDYNNSEPSNTYPSNKDPVTSLPDTFFNSVVSTQSIGRVNSSKYWHRVFCNTRASFLTVEWTLSNLQMTGPEQQSDVGIESQILYMRPAGKQLPQGF